jgi:6,7-dimethyl-8-ribityllumazine synthase
VTVDTVVADLDAGDLHIGVVRSLFNREVTDGLLEGALAVLEDAGAGAVTVVEAPGAFEIPLLASRLVARGCDAVVAIGAVVEGETDHYEHVAHRASEGLMRVMLDTGAPITFGILTVRSADHAFARSGPGGTNKGAEAAEAAIATANLLLSLESRVPSPE